MKMTQMVPDATDLLALEPEELRGVLLEYLNALPPNENYQFHRSGFESGDAVTGYPSEHQDSIRAAFVEAWVWLEREGLIVPKPQDHHGWMILSRRGRQLRKRGEVTSYRHGNLLPRGQLHATIATKVYATFLRGAYDTAVFEAFKEVEVAVRSAANLAQTDIGIALMRKAWDKSVGALTDMDRPEAEREATAHLFAGAIGLYKNPHSHRNVPLSDPMEAVEMIVLASQLLRIVDGRRP